MEEDLTEYIHSVNNNPEERDAQAFGYAEEVCEIHDSELPDGRNSYNVPIRVLLLSYFERLSYYDENRVSYESYARYARFLEQTPRKEKDYDANRLKEEEDGYKGVEGSRSALVKVASEIENPAFRVYLVLLSVCLLKDIGPLTKRQKLFLEDTLKALRID